MSFTYIFIYSYIFIYTYVVGIAGQVRGFTRICEMKTQRLLEDEPICPSQLRGGGVSAFVD